MAILSFIKNVFLISDSPRARPTKIAIGGLAQIKILPSPRCVSSKNAMREFHVVRSVNVRIRMLSSRRWRVTLLEGMRQANCLCRRYIWNRCSVKEFDDLVGVYGLCTKPHFPAPETYAGINTTLESWLSGAVCLIIRWCPRGVFKFFIGRVSSAYCQGIIVGMGAANARRRHHVTSSFIGWTHTQNEPCVLFVQNNRNKYHRVWPGGWDKVW